ncbi:hypothetical protein BDR04DRAFT_1122806 [Suillus decipiens]|nr:hypothetical protein BDR04DRAFT_1122806 [Suillus decipiens]
MLERTLKLHKGVNRFIQLVDDSDEVPNLQGKSYGAFKLSAKEWKKLELMHDMLQEPANAQQSFSVTHEPTVWHVILVPEFLQQTWQNMARSLKFSNFSTTIESGIDNLSLDLNYKIAYAKSKWEPRNFKKGMRCLQIIFDRYHHHNSLPDAEPAVVAPSCLACQGSYGHSWMHDTVKSHVASDTASRRPCQELEDYLASLLEDIENIHHSIQYPTISCIAKDYLTIQGSAVASE